MSKQAIVSTGKVLGALLYFPPKSERILALIPWLQEREWTAEWPFISAEAALQNEKLFDESVSYSEPLDDAFQRLFVGPYALPAPPWAFRYLALLKQSAEHPFYRAVALLAQNTLEGWQQGCILPTVEHELYR